MRRESGKLLRQMFFAALGALHARYVVGAAYQLLKLRPAIVTAIFKDRHTLYYRRTDAIHNARANGEAVTF